MAVFLTPEAAATSGTVSPSTDFSPPTSPSPVSATFLLTDDAYYSRYENVRPQSQFSTIISNALNSPATFHAARHSIVSTLDDGSTVTQVHYGLEPSATLRRRSEGMPQMEGGGVNDTTNTIAKLKYYYDHSILRHFAPFFLLAIYTIVGAYTFYMVEHENEKKLQRKEEDQLNKLRNETFLRLRELIVSHSFGEAAKTADSRQILLSYEKDLTKVKLPEALEWDMWGAIFYVGTVLTTIGYGNITPRTVGGQALSILYAIIGIPLVLAILNQFSKKMTKFLSAKWIKYRQKVRFQKLKELKARKLSRQRKSLYNIESGALPQVTADQNELCDEVEHRESRTIPVWVALSLCVSYICLVAALFCLWETRWTYFNSFYFICISCLTIGLGDIIPDHPHVLILMFVFVIFGLSIVSMLISVIQIKMEEWLYRMMIKMREEYKRKLESGEIVPELGQHILNTAMQNEPWYMRNLAQFCISDKQASKLDEQAETFEKVMRVTNNKNIQTDIIQPLGTHTECQTQFSDQDRRDSSEESAQKSAATPPTESVEMLSAFEYFPPQSDASVQEELPLHRAAPALLRILSNDSLSEATSLPMDPISNVVMTADAHVQTSALPTICAIYTQTVIDSFHMDAFLSHEIKRKNRPLLVDYGVDPICTSDDDSPSDAIYTVERHSVEIQTNLPRVVSEQSVQTLHTVTLDSSVSTDDFIEKISASLHTQTSFDRTEANERKKSSSAQTAPTTESSTMSSLVVPTADAALDPLDDEGTLGDANSKRRRFSNSKHLLYSFEETPLNERSTQYSLTKEYAPIGTQVTPEDIDFETGSSAPTITPSLFLNDQSQEIQDLDDARSDSVIVFTGDDDTASVCAPPRPEKQDLVIQTDDSYLRIARRLNQYRTNRTQTLQIYSTPFSVSTESSLSPISGPNSPYGLQSPRLGDDAMSPGTSRRVCFESVSDTEAQERNQRRRSSQKKNKYHQNFLQPAADRIRQSFKRKRQRNEKVEKKVEEDPRDAKWHTQDKKDLLRKTSQTSIERKVSFTSTDSGKANRVLEFVAKHERGIHNPGTPEGQKNSYVTVVDMRQQSEQ